MDPSVHRSPAFALSGCFFIITVLGCQETTTQPTRGVSVEPLLSARRQHLTALDGAAGDTFGHSLAIDGDALVVGSQMDDHRGRESGSAYVFQRAGERWVQAAKLTASDAEAEDRFGYALAIDDDTVLVGAWGDDDRASRAGAVYVFVNRHGRWEQEAKLTASDGAEDDFFGMYLDIDGDTAIIGAANDDDEGEQSGSVYIFTRSDGLWTEEAKVTASDGEADDRFGSAVAINDGVAVVGAWGRAWRTTIERVGIVFVLRPIDGEWRISQRLIPDRRVAHDRFGQSVSFDGERIAVSAPGRDDVGRVILFDQVPGGGWTEGETLIAADAEPGDQFGFSIGLDGDVLVVGTSYDDDFGRSAGAMYVFHHAAGSWAEEAKLYALDARPEDFFGHAVAVADGTALVGVWGDDERGEMSGSAWALELTITGYACDSGDECSTGFCVDGVCCRTECGGGDPDDCEACSEEAGGEATCRDSAGECDGVEVCDGLSSACPFDDLTAMDGEPCDDGEASTEDDTCQDGVCIGTAPDGDADADTDSDADVDADADVDDDADDGADGDSDGSSNDSGCGCQAVGHGSTDTLASLTRLLALR